MPSGRPRPKQPPVPDALRACSELNGVVKNIVFTSPDGAFQVARFFPEDTDIHITIAGNLPGVAPGEPIRVEGQWKTHRQHGDTFEVSSYVPVMPTDPKVLGKYLGSGLIKGIGKAYAKRIIEHFGEETLDVLDHAPERLAEVRGLGRRRAQDVSRAWEEHRKIHDVMIILTRYGIEPGLARRLFRHYGNEAAAVLRTNPYRAGMEVSGIGFLTADRLAAAAGIATDSPHRIRAGLVHVLDRASDAGHTHLPQEMLLEQTVELLALPAQQVEEVFEQELTASASALRREKLPSGVQAVFMRSLYTSESGLARVLLELSRTKKPLPVENVASQLDAFEQRYRFALDVRQREAIHSVTGGGVVVVTGGPGTGKTTLVRALLHVLRGANLEIAMCSPTGRAAQRLAETTGERAQTIHRLLKYNAALHAFHHGPDEPVPCDLLIVDESSMLDVPLAYQLTRALKPGTCVVFVGDVDQLPSVGAGNFLHDLIESGRVDTVRLDVIFRQARQSQIIVNSHRVNEGKMPNVLSPKEGDPEPDFYFIERDEPQGIREGIVALVTERIPRKFGFNPVNDVQVLTPMRRGDLGTHELNRLLQDTLNSGSGARPVGGTFMREGDKVIQNSNNYDLEVFNGDVGKVMRVHQENQTVTVLFGRRSVEYTLDEADQLSLAYAVTIHKSQGSEYPAVIVLMHTSHFIMLRRNLLYTAITRGKKLVIVIGSRRALGKAVRTGSEEKDKRLSALAEWLARPPEGEDLFS